MDERSLVRDWRAKSYPWQAISNMTRRAVVDLRRDYDPSFMVDAPPAPEPKRFISRIEAISTKVAERYGCTLTAMKTVDGLGATRAVHHARSAAYDACVSAGVSVVEVARFYGRDQSTVRQARKAHQRRQRDGRQRAA